MIGIYKIENLINNKIYIGQSIDIQRRWRDHKNNALKQQNKNLLYSDILNYDINNFSFIVLEECKIEELDEKQKYWIQYYNSYNNGYNLTIGGAGKRKVNPENIIELWNNNCSIEEIMNILNISYNTVTRTLHINNLGYIPLEKRTNLLAPMQSVIQYDLNGNFIALFKSIADAVDSIKNDYPYAGTGNICQACKKKITTAYGYLWKYANDNTSIEELVNNANNKLHHRNRKVDQYDLNDNYIKTFNTLREAQNSIGCKSMSSIVNACTGRSKTAGGYKWKYHDI